MDLEMLTLISVWGGLSLPSKLALASRTVASVELTPAGSDQGCRHRNMESSSMQALVKFTLTLAVFFAGGSVAFAEGGCPAGQYPIGGQGVQGCAPIPSAGSGGGDLRPNGRWTKTWGAISISPSTLDVGTSVGQKSKAAAFAEAKARCSTYGAKDCGENFSYKNQCVAVAAPAGGRRGGVYYSTAATKELAVERATQACKQGGGASDACAVSYSDCTEPTFHSY